jgi:hypothetical protein
VWYGNKKGEDSENQHGQPYAKQSFHGKTSRLGSKPALTSFGASPRPFYFVGETVPDILAEVLQFLGEILAGFISACRCEQQSDAYAKANSRRQAKRMAGCVILPAAYYLGSPISETVDLVPYAVPHRRRGIFRLVQKVNAGSK